MSARPTAARFARFGIFEADLQERALHRNGLGVTLQNQPFEVLAALLERPGETVTGEELSRRVRPEGTYVEFEHSLSTAVLKIRKALDDSAESPRFIETIPRHGHRFIAPVQLVSESRFAAGNSPRSLCAVAFTRSEHYSVLQESGDERDTRRRPARPARSSDYFLGRMRPSMSGMTKDGSMRHGPENVPVSALHKNCMEVGVG